MKKLFSIISIFVLSSITFGQNQVKIVSKEDGIDYTGQTATFSSGDKITVGGLFYVINTSSTTNTYKYGVLPLSASEPTYIFQFCEIEGGYNPGLCYNCPEPIGTFWETPTIMEDIAPGDSMTIDIKLNVGQTAGTGKAIYYVLNDHGFKIDSVTLHCTSTASVEKEELPTFKIYPNPAQDGVTIQGEGLKNGGTIVFQDALGQEVKRVYLSEMHTLINVSALNKGIYFVSITDNKGVKSKVQRLVVQ